MTHPALAALVQPDKDVRQQAAVALGQVPHAELADELAELLWSEPDFFVRETLTWVLVRTPQESAAAAVSALTSSRSPDSTRLQALHLLSKIADPIAVDAASAVAGLLDHENPLVADKARWTLARIGGPEAVPALVAQLGEADAAARDSLTTALAQLGASAVGPLVGSLSAADPLVRSHAADVLCFIGAAAEAAGVAIQLHQLGSMFGMFFNVNPVTDYASAATSDQAAFKIWFHTMLEQGVYLAPSQFEAGFMSAAHSDADIEKTVLAAKVAMQAVAQSRKQ